VNANWRDGRGVNGKIRDRHLPGWPGDPRRQRNGSVVVSRSAFSR
jgi:hypothetical protein